MFLPLSPTFPLSLKINKILKKKKKNSQTHHAATEAGKPFLQMALRLAWSPGAAVATHHKLRGLSNRNVLSHSLEATGPQPWRVPATLVPKAQGRTPPAPSRVPREPGLGLLPPACGCPVSEPVLLQQH